MTAAMILMLAQLAAEMSAAVASQRKIVMAAEGDGTVPVGTWDRIMLRMDRETSEWDEGG